MKGNQKFAFWLLWILFAISALAGETTDAAIFLSASLLVIAMAGEK